MPIHFHKNQRFSIQLDSDINSDNRFYFRPATGEEVAGLCEIQDRVTEAGSGAKGIGVIFDAIRETLTGWTLTDADGKEVPFEPEKLIKYLTLPEARELLGKLLESVAVGAETEKKS